MKQIFDLFTRAEVEIIVNTGKLSEEQKALFKREGIAQKEAINYAKEVLKYLPSDEATETEEEFDEENYFEEDSEQEDNQSAPTSNNQNDVLNSKDDFIKNHFIIAKVPNHWEKETPKQETPTTETTAQATETTAQEEEAQPAELLQEIEKVVAEQPAPQQEQKRIGRTALERMAMLDKLEELKEKHEKTTQMLTRIAGMTKEHNENEGVSLRIETPKFPNITISKNLAVGLCLKFVFEETDKQRRAIENEIENLEF